MRLPVYLDHNATTPCDPGVLEAMLPYFAENFGNAASRHHTLGWMAEDAVAEAREEVAQLIGADPAEIIFTSGATEADNLAIKGIFEEHFPGKGHIITAATEHNAVLDTCRHLQQKGARVTVLPVGGDGLVDPAGLEAAIAPDTVLIALMYANNETGVLQPMREISALAQKRGVLLFSDAVQAVGKIPLNVRDTGIDLMAFTAHKMYGPKGVGALYIRRRGQPVSLRAQMDGGGHERKLRSGTLNVPGIVGFGKAAALAAERMEQDALHAAVLRDRLEDALLQLSGTAVNGNREQRLPHVTNISFGGVEGEELLTLLNNNDIALSSGSACSSATTTPSHVLKAMGLDDVLAYASLRFSLGRSNTEEQISYTLRRIDEAVTALRNP
ncbi:cysteine desulfurase family protein [Compostibacter hankyongensis]|uniref:cysteine desulfurase n=1 Tax=Compostibacter hankyongensis TaxID=1007089 RepID=A0ABP8FLX7_9BACT